MTRLLDSLRGADRKLLVPYLMGGLPDRDAFAGLLASLDEVSDAIEVGVPYSDPLMDGPVIADAGERALAAGIKPADVIDLVASAASRRPNILMTYYNPIHRIGEDAYCRAVAEAGVAGLIVPDIPLEESVTLRRTVAAHDLAWIPLVAPTSPPERVAAITGTATGFVYAVSTLGVTGVRTSLSSRAATVVEACRQGTDLPVLVGIGVSSPEQAVEAASVADGVVIGSAVVKRTLEEGPSSVLDFLRSVRSALDSI